MSQTDNTTTQAETKSNVLTGLEVIETLGLDDTIYHSELFQQIRELDNFKALAWTPNVRQLYYNREKNLLLSNIEGDLFLYQNPDKAIIVEEVQKYPKAEVALGEKYDSRFQEATQ
jgi:hypothetical protein